MSEISDYNSMASNDFSVETVSTPLLKDQINTSSITTLARLIKQYQPEFPIDFFMEQATFQLESMSLKNRVNHISTIIARLSVDDYELNAHWLKQLATNWPSQDSTKGWHSYIAWPLIEFAGEQGLAEPEIALEVLKQLTPLFTAEFAIRPYLEQHFDLTYNQMLIWCQNPNEHVRRLASEGIRPRLPWGKHLKTLQHNPEPILELLKLLQDDTSRYVQKSVANNLNDISKDHPSLVIELCREWLKNATTQRQWIIRHGLRGLIKAGHPEVFPLLGYTNNSQVNAELMLSERHIRIGDVIGLKTKIHSESSNTQRMVVDYRIWHIKAHGQSNGKVFKWKNINLLAGETIELFKTHGFLKMTTRRYYNGIHSIEILINGVSYAKEDFNLIVD